MSAASPSTGTRCFICGGETQSLSVGDYQRCSVCGHETLIATDAQQFMVNDDIASLNISKPDVTVRFQTKVVQQICLGTGLLVDIGCGSGKFLFHNRGNFKRLLGIEVSEESAAFARDRFQLEILPSLSDLNITPDVVTFWHSLEHIPTPAIGSILATLYDKMAAESRLVVSVPNADSLAYRWLGRRYAFYDAPYHLHQFTPHSLQALLASYGFTVERVVFSPAYSGFCWLQTLMNTGNTIHNYFYYRLKRGKRYKISPLLLRLLDIYNLFLAVFFAPFVFFLLAFDAIRPLQQGSLTLCCLKKQ